MTFSIDEYDVVVHYLSPQDDLRLFRNRYDNFLVSFETMGNVTPTLKWIIVKKYRALRGNSVGTCIQTG